MMAVKSQQISPIYRFSIKLSSGDCVDYSIYLNLFSYSLPDVMLELMQNMCYEHLHFIQSNQRSCFN